MVEPLSSQLIREREPTDIWRRQCEVVQIFGRNRFEVGFTTKDGNEALIAAGLPALDSEQMRRALNDQSFKPTSDLKTRRMKIGDFLLSRLKEAGVRHLFGVPGDYNLELLQQLQDTGALKWIGTCSELNSPTRRTVMHG